MECIYCGSSKHDFKNCGKFFVGDCVICGAKSVVFSQHKCPDNVIRSKDAAGERDDDVKKNPSWYERLKEGFRLIDEDEVTE